MEVREPTIRFKVRISDRARAEVGIRAEVRIRVRVQDAFNRLSTAVN